ncbi:MAG TPA: hypothetical protein PLI66_04205 [Spirochaetales bacterium]|nr:hypothetical protein [Spirochaetales bacterium]
MSPRPTEYDSCPSADWFEEATESFSDRWDSTPWHDNGERKLAPLKGSLRVHAPSINRLPETFLPSVLDQYLAVLSEGYEYQALDCLRILGDDRYLCANDSGETFYVWSRSMTINVSEAGYTFLTAIIRLRGEGGEPTPAITYGPVLSWKALRAADFSAIGRELARDLYRLQGLSAVIRRDPVPFWAAWALGDAPIMKHGTEELCTCWQTGRFSASPETALSGSWKRDEVGKRIRLRKPGSKPFFEQVVIYDSKTSLGLVLTRRRGYQKKLIDSLASVFTPDAEEPCVASAALEMVFSDILKRKLGYADWTRPFDQLDEKRLERDRDRHPERESELDSLNDALQALLPHINAHREPDWEAFAAEHDVDAGLIDTLKSFYQKYARGS